MAPARAAPAGFDVVYLPPIHPIGTHQPQGAQQRRAGREPGDVGSPWAIGSDAGGHEAVAAELGGLAAFLHSGARPSGTGMEVALDLAIQASPDHPWVSEHPEWFRHAPRRTIRYAENPPKRYQDVYPFDFHARDPAAAPHCGRPGATWC